MLKVPSARRHKKGIAKLNLTPILDAVFIFIFFLLVSANFLKVYEIGSDVPMASDSPPPKDQKAPLALTLKIYPDNIRIYTGVPSRLLHRVTKTEENKYDLANLHAVLVDLKSKNVDEESIILEPLFEITYGELIEIIDATRTIENTDAPIYKKDKDNVDVKVEKLFPKVVFGNLLS